MRFIRITSLCALALATGAESRPASVAATLTQQAIAARVECAVGTKCSPGVGMISIIEPPALGQCTATLVAPNVLVTAAHCVPLDIRENNASCAGKIWMHFAPTPRHPEYESMIACDRVLQTVGGNNFDLEEPDMAVLILKKASVRPTQNISRDGFPDGEKVMLEAVDPVSAPQNLAGIIRKKSCKAVQHTFAARWFRWDQAKVPLFSDCLVRAGNSGTALQDAQGNVRGVIASVVKNDKLKFNLIDNNFFAVNEQLSALALGTAVGCFELPPAVGAPSIPAACEEGGGMNLSAQKQNEAAITQVVPYQVQNERFPAYGWFHWRVKTTNKTLVLAPTCVANERASGSSGEVGTVEYTMRTGIDRYARYVSLSIAPAYTNPAVAQVGSGEGGYYRVLIEGEKYRLPLCEQGRRDTSLQGVSSLEPAVSRLGTADRAAAVVSGRGRVAAIAPRPWQKRSPASATCVASPM